MVEIISVRFKEGGRQYYFNPNGERFRLGEGVIVETARGVEFGECTQENTAVDEMELTAPLRPVLRRATPEDQLTREKNKEKEARAFQICQEKIAEHGLEMKLVEAEYSFEGNKVLFFFTAEGRVDFRALVKDLASAIHARIELRQIGVWASAGGPSAAPSSWRSSSRCPSRWPRLRTCLSTPPRSPAPAGGSCAA